MTDFLPNRAIEAALQLACAVREYDSVTIARVLGRTDINDITVVLAAMVDIDQTPRTLLAWNDGPAAFPRTVRLLRPHGTHAAFMRHRKAGEDPCAACWAGERAYQRDRKRAARTVSA